MPLNLQGPSKMINSYEYDLNIEYIYDDMHIQISIGKWWISFWHIRVKRIMLNKNRIQSVSRIINNK